jgi:hypothetical protein
MPGQAMFHVDKGLPDLHFNVCRNNDHDHIVETLIATGGLQFHI